MPTSLEDYTPEQIEKMAETYRAAMTNPETREVMLRVTKKLDPTVSIPEIDMKDAIRASQAKEAEERAKLEQEIRERDARDRIRDERSKLRDKGYSAEDVNAIEKLMTDEQKNGNILTYDLAATLYDNSRRIAEPSPHNPKPLNLRLPADPLAALREGGRAGLKKFGRDQAAAALDEIRGGQIKLH